MICHKQGLSSEAQSPHEQRLDGMNGGHPEAARGLRGRTTSIGCVRQSITNGLQPRSSGDLIEEIYHGNYLEVSGAAIHFTLCTVGCEPWNPERTVGVLGINDL